MECERECECECEDVPPSPPPAHGLGDGQSQLVSLLLLHRRRHHVLLDVRQTERQGSEHAPSVASDSHNLEKLSLRFPACLEGSGGDGRKTKKITMMDDDVLVVVVLERETGGRMGHDVKT